MIPHEFRSGSQPDSFPEDHSDIGFQHFNFIEDQSYRSSLICDKPNYESDKEKEENQTNYSEDSGLRS